MGKWAMLIATVGGMGLVMLFAGLDRLIASYPFLCFCPQKNPSSIRRQNELAKTTCITFVQATHKFGC